MDRISTSVPHNTIPALRNFSSCGVALSSLDMKVCTVSYCNLLCHVWLIFLRDIAFAEEEWRKGSSRDRISKGVEGGETVVGMYCVREE